MSEFSTQKHKSFMKGNPSTPWNPREPTNTTPVEYEKQVLSWLEGACPQVNSFRIEHLKKLSGSGGEYEFDGVAEIEVFNGAIIKILIECKRYSSPVEREVILAFHSKILDVGAHKGMVFSTSGFQKGAISYATSKGIAAISFFEGQYLYETRSLYPPYKPPSHLQFPKFAGSMFSGDENRFTVSTFDESNLEVLGQFLNGDFVDLKILEKTTR